MAAGAPFFLRRNPIIVLCAVLRWTRAIRQRRHRATIVQTKQLLYTISADLVFH